MAVHMMCIAFIFLRDYIVNLVFQEFQGPLLAKSGIGVAQG